MAVRWKFILPDLNVPCVSPTDPLCTRYMEFVCKNRAQCLFQSLVCDGIKHCEDGSDEEAAYAGCGEQQTLNVLLMIHVQTVHLSKSKSQEYHWVMTVEMQSKLTFHVMATKIQNM